MKILVSDPLAKEGIQILKGQEGIEVDVKPKLPAEELLRCIGEYDGLIVRSGTKVTPAVIEHADKLKIIGRAGVGVDNVDLPAATKKGVIVMNTPGGNTISAAEHTIALLLALARNIPFAHASLKAKKWERKKFMGSEVQGKTLGIVGLGRIGKEVARRALSFGMQLLAYDPFISGEVARKMGIKLVELKTLLKDSDYITVHTPLNEQTRNLIGEKEFALVKPTVRIINVGRGGIINENALAEAIKNNQVAGAAIDVWGKEPPFESPLLELDKVIVTPHLGASTEEAQVAVAVDIANQMVDYFKDGTIRNSVNLPPLELELMKKLKPYLVLAEKIGCLLGQLSEGRIKEVSIEYSGETAEYDVSWLTSSGLVGMLNLILEEEVNLINAPVIAKDRGIEVKETKVVQAKGFANLIEGEITTDQGKIVVGGVVFGKDNLRIVRVQDFYLETIPEGNMLIYNNKDVPGIIGKVGNILGQNKINIARMEVGRGKPGGEALTVVNIDQKISPEILDEIKQIPEIIRVKAVEL